MLPAIDAEPTAAGKLAAYIRSNAEYLQTHRGYAMALLEIWTSFRTGDGLRLDEAAAQSQPTGDLARLDPEYIFRLGQKRREFRVFAPQTMAIALRQAIDGAALHASRDPDFDVVAYCEELVTVSTSLPGEPRPPVDHPADQLGASFIDQETIRPTRRTT